MANNTKIQAVRKILLKDWDPFCVGDNPNLSDEYDSFIDGIIQLLDKQANSTKIKQHLMQIEEQLDAPVKNDARISTVKALQSVAKDMHGV